MVGFAISQSVCQFAQFGITKPTSKIPSAFPHSDVLRLNSCAFIVVLAGHKNQCLCQLVLCLLVLCVSHAEEAHSHWGPHAHGHLEWPGLLQIDAGRSRQRAAEHQPPLLQALPEYHQQPAATGANRFWFHGHKLKWKNKTKVELELIEFWNSSTCSIR